MLYIYTYMYKLYIYTYMYKLYIYTYMYKYTTLIFGAIHVSS